MKQIIIAILLITLCGKCTLFSMEEGIELQLLHQTTEQPTHTNNPDNIPFTIIDEAIKKKYAHKQFLFGLLSSSLTPTQALDIINTPCQLYDLSDGLLDALYAKNSFFCQAIDHFIKLAHENVERITINNITTIEDPKSIQPTLPLNDLPLQTKSYVMQQALKQKNHTYDILLIGHQNRIEAFDICEATHQAVTACNDKTLCLWDLTTGKLHHTFDERNQIHILAFHPDGFCIAAALYSINAVKIWCPKTGNELFNLPSPYAIDSLAYTHPIHSTLTAAHNSTALITQWTITAHNPVAGECFNHSHVHEGRNQYSSFQGKHYKAQHPGHNLIDSSKTLCVTKDCPPLYLLKKAIEKTHNKESLKITTIENSQSYKKLTSLEKTMIKDLS